MTETSAEERRALFDDAAGRERGAWVPTIGSLAGAAAMTSCCILPLVLVSFGVGGVWIAQLTALYAWKWYTFAAASGFIAWGFWKLRQSDAGECRDGTACARPVNRRIMKVSLWLATLVTAVAMIFPYVTPWILSY